MPDADNWDKETVVRQIAAQAGASGLVSAMIFLAPGVGSVALAAKALVDAAVKATGASERRQSVGRVREVSRAFAVQVEPEVLEAIAHSDEVKNVLPTEIPDILPQPVHRRAVG